MSRVYIPVELRRLVVERADRLCEYCLILETDRVSGCHIALPNDSFCWRRAAILRQRHNGG